MTAATTAARPTSIHRLDLTIVFLRLARVGLDDKLAVGIGRVLAFKLAHTPSTKNGRETPHRPAELIRPELRPLRSELRPSLISGNSSAESSSVGSE